MTAIPPIAFIGAGRVASALARAFVGHGIGVAAIASRSHETARRLAAQVDGSRAVSIDEAAREPLVFVTVPDDEIEPLVSRLAWVADQQVAHCSGATEVSALDAALRSGARSGGFHPLQTFSDPDRAIALLSGTTVAIEGPPALDATLREIATRLGMKPLTLPAGARGAYHGGAGFAAGFIVSMIEEAAAIWRTFGITEADALAALLPLARGNLDALAARGVAGALTGPIPRGEVGVVERHLQAFDGAGPDHGRLYREFARRQVRLALDAGRIDPGQAARLEATLDR